MHRKAHVAYDFRSLIETEGRFKVTCSHIRCVCGR